LGTPKTSYFHLTVSSNVRAKSPAHKDTLLEKMEKIVHDLFADPGIIDYLPGHNPNGEVIIHGPEDSVIDSIKARVAAEVGPRRNIPHWHIVIKVKHRSKIHLNTKHIQRFLNNNMSDVGVKNMYVNVQGYSNAVVNWKIYQEKTLGMNPEEIYDVDGPY